jgi:peptide/nickel transport system substrate-binding protein
MYFIQNNFQKYFKKRGDEIVKKKPTLPLLIVLVLCMAMFLAACSGNGSSEKTSKSGEKNTSKNASSENVKGKPLVVVPEPKGDYDKNFNPFDQNALSGTNGLLYEPLAYLDPISGKIHNFLATGEKWSDDNKTLTVTVNDDAKWSDGKDFSVDDVVFTFNYLKKH